MTKKIFITTIMIAVLLTGIYVPKAKADSSPILITEVQTGYTNNLGVENPKQEYVEIANLTAAPINLTGWRIEYLSAASNGTGAVTYLIDIISGQISAGGHGIWEHDGYYPIPPDNVFASGDTASTGKLAKTGGHIRIMNGTTMMDCVGWGSAVAIAGCDMVSAVAAPGYTLQRRLLNGTYLKSDGVVNLSPPTPKGNNIYNVNAVTTPANPTIPVQTTPQPECNAVQLSEILANPAGDDTLGEFIELYNPTDQTQSLYGCSLTNASGKQYSFSETANIASHEYKSFPYSTTSLQLGNAGGTVTLTTISSSTTTTYPAVNDDEAWALIAGNWAITKTPTPSAPNVLTQVPASVANSVVSTIAVQEECSDGKIRNPDTGRCKNTEVASLKAPCAADQERNPSTGRCRRVVATVAPAICAAGQEKNPATNRCRKINVAPTEKTCPTGQERNKQTNRCRKVVVATSGKVLGDKTSKKTYNYLIVGFIFSSVIGYGLYEYRQDIANLWRRLSLKVARR